MIIYGWLYWPHCASMRRHWNDGNWIRGIIPKWPHVSAVFMWVNYSNIWVNISHQFDDANWIGEIIPEWPRYCNPVLETLDFSQIYPVDSHGIVWYMIGSYSIYHPLIGTSVNNLSSFRALGRDNLSVYCLGNLWISPIQVRMRCPFYGVYTQWLVHSLFLRKSNFTALG